MLAAINAVAAEFSNTRRRAPERVADVDRLSGRRRARRASSRRSCCSGNDWRSVFYFGAAVTALLIPIVLLRDAGVGALAGAQAAGRRAREDQSRADGGWATRRSTALPAMSAWRRKRSIGDIFAPGARRDRRRSSTLAYFFHITTFYFIVKWVPKIVVDMGFAAVVGGGRAGLDQRRRRDRRRGLRAAHAALRREAADDRACWCCPRSW